MEYGFAAGAQVGIDKARQLPIQILRPGDTLLGFVEGNLFPVTVDYCQQMFVRAVQVTKTEAFNLKCGKDQPVYQYSGYRCLKHLRRGDILLKQTQEPARILDTQLYVVNMPVYVLQTYPNLPFIINGFIVGGPGSQGDE